MNFKQRKIIRQILIKTGYFISCMPETDYEYGPVRWTERAMRAACLYKSCRLIMSHTDSIKYIQFSLKKKNRIVLDGFELYELINVGRKGDFVRYWHWLTHFTMDDMIDHAYNYRAYKSINVLKTAEDIGVPAFYEA